MITLLSSLSAQQVECAGNANILVKTFSAQAVSVERATGDSAVAKSFSAQMVDMEHATGDNKIIRSISSSKAGYDINGTEIVVPDYRVNITRVK